MFRFWTTLKKKDREKESFYLSKCFVKVDGRQAGVYSVFPVLLFLGF